MTLPHPLPLTLIPLLLLTACASSHTTNTPPTQSAPVSTPAPTNQPKPQDPYAGTPYEGTATQLDSLATTQGNGLPSDQDPTYNPNSPVYSDPDPALPFPASSGRYHIVEPGDTLWKIAREYGTNVRTLRAINGFDDKVTTIRPGDKIKLP
jgi:LysM repeat protein